MTGADPGAGALPVAVAAAVLTVGAVALLLPPPAPRRALRARSAADGGNGPVGGPGPPPDGEPDPSAASPLQRYALLWGVVGGGGVALLLGGLVGLAAGVATAVLLVRTVRRAETPAARRRREELEAALPAVVDLVAAALAAGAAPGPALAVVSRSWGGAVAHELDRVVRRLALGADPVTVWTELAAHPQWGPLGRALARATDSGSSIADALHALGSDLRRSAQAQAQARARSVGARAAVPLGVCLLPSFVLVGVVPMIVAGLGASGLGDLLAP